MVILAIDAMGGDNAPYAQIIGADIFAGTQEGVNFKIYGNKDFLIPLLKKCKNLKSRYELIHTNEFVASDLPPIKALRLKNSSMQLGIDSIKNQTADAFISAGNSGALMAMSKISLRMLGGVDRPALAALFPTETGFSVMLDLGANLECNANNLLQFAIMGEAFANYSLSINNPSVALLNVGSEHIKGHDTIKLASQMISENCEWMNFIGYVEGNTMIKGVADVVVADGFSGNIALKTAEGTASLCKNLLRKASKSSFLSRLGFLLSSFSIKKTLKLIDPRLYNGAMFLGLNGIIIKSHGNADAIAFANALDVATKLVRGDINKHMYEKLIGLPESLTSENEVAL